MKDQEYDNLISQYDTADVFPVVNRYPADLITPLGAYLSISEGREHSFLFESVEGGESLARYSIMGAGPDSIHEEKDGGEIIFDLLRRELGEKKVAEVDGLPAFIGGAVGYFDFSAVEQFETGLSEKGFDVASMTKFMFFRTVVVFDHVRQEILIVTLLFKNPDDQFRDLYLEAKTANNTLAQKLGSFVLRTDNDAPESAASEPVTNMTKTEFVDSVNEIKELIAAGDVYQVVLSRCFRKATIAGPVPIYRALRSLNPSPYMFLVKTGDRAVIGASPEMLVKCTGTNLEYRPIAGTRPRSGEKQEDARLAEEMLHDPKELAEHTMLVDLGRNDLGRVAKYGTVKVAGLMHVEKFSHVQHLVSSLTAELDNGKDGFDAFAACFPAGTVSGAPKIKAIETIYRLEPTPRGLYAGAVGYFGYAGNMDTCIAIRTIVLENGVASVQSGAGIVADSVPEKEYEETAHKAAGLLRAIELAESGNYGI